MTDLITYIRSLTPEGLQTLDKDLSIIHRVSFYTEDGDDVKPYHYSSYEDFLHSVEDATYYTLHGKAVGWIQRDYRTEWKVRIIHPQGIYVPGKGLIPTLQEAVATIEVMLVEHGYLMRMI
jgi:hypothetical protein